MNREDLKNYKYEKEWIKDRMQELEERKEIINKLIATYGPYSGGSSEVNDRLAERLAKLMDKTNEYAEMLNESEKRLFKIIEMLDKMNHKLYRNILYKRYIIGIKMEEIAVSIEKDFKYTCTLHGYALNEFDKICENYKLVV